MLYKSHVYFFNNNFWQSSYCYFKLIYLCLLKVWPFFILQLSRWWIEINCSTQILGIHKCKMYSFLWREICLHLTHCTLQCNKKIYSYVEFSIWKWKSSSTKHFSMKCNMIAMNVFQWCILIKLAIDDQPKCSLGSRTDENLRRDKSL